MILSTLGYALFGFACLAGFLYLYQRKMIYFPQRYPPGLVVEGSGLVDIAYETAQGIQHAYYVAPRENPGELPGRLWMMFGGNASLALQWTGFVSSVPDSRAGFLLFEYPGYGECAGKPTRASIAESSEAAFQALAAHLNVEAEALEKDLNVMGYSIGAATALEFAANHPVRRVVLLAPFTSLLDMAQRQVGWPLKHLAIDRFDNRARLDELAARDKPPVVLIVHGRADNIVPFRMGEELAARHPAMTALHPVTGDGHNDLLDSAAARLHEFMQSRVGE